MESLRWNNANIHNKIMNGKSRSKNGLNNEDIKRIEKFYDVSLPLQTGGAREIKILSLNVEMHANMLHTCKKAATKKLRDEKNALSALSRVIKSAKPDVICLQEDVIKTNLGLTEWLAFMPPKYNLVNQCLSHPVKSKLGVILSNSIYAKAGLDIDHSFDESFSNIENITSNQEAVDRCAVYAKINGLLIANIHLTGGRNDDKKYKILGEIKIEQLKTVLIASPDVIVGDFNGDVAIDSQLDSYQAFTSLNSANKVLFEKYWIAGHELLSSKGYIRAPFGEKTSEFGTRPDHIYYKPDIVEIIGMEIVPFIKVPSAPGKTLKYSDHNGLMVTLQIKDAIKDRPCNSIMSYDCAIFEDGFSEVLLKDNSIIYRSGIPLDNAARFFAGNVTGSGYSYSRGTLPIKYLTKTPLRLLDMNNARNIKNILKVAKDTDIRTYDLLQLYFMSIKTINNPPGTFITYSGQPRPLHKSQCNYIDSYKHTICTEGHLDKEDNSDPIDNDYIARKALKFICSQDFDGWIHVGMMARARQTKFLMPGYSSPIKLNSAQGFHDEIGICDLRKLELLTS
uniref:Endonuclease/exonuclease/phosphatase domain-containing protein n=1 Tax=viral metagenome TaxID=1070528 RepID=A0A6C0J9X0_9ZZZZ